MAATLMRVMANAAGWGDSLWVDSCGVSDEEEGNPMDRRAVATLLSHGIRPAQHELLDYTDDPHDIDDPWYTGDFEKAYREIREGCTGYLRQFRIK